MLEKKKLASTKSRQTSERTVGTSENPLGKKHTCYACGKKFYDLNKPQAICPGCGADQKSKPALKSRAAKLRYSEFDVVDEELPTPLDEEIEFGEDADVEETILDDEE
ncbi:MAG: TIGR02300 family protein [Leptospiraceae bacterium]|nr:TIGR02300 family protein [Leptospiraceae bacterium]